MLTKFTFYGFVLQCLLLTALFAMEGSAQIRSVKDVRIDLQVNKTKIREALKAIEKTTEFNFVYTPEELDMDQIVTLNVRRKPVSYVLMEISRQANVKFKQVNNNISVQQLDIENNEKPEKDIVVMFQNVSVTGKVVSAEDNSGLPGVNVVLKGTSQGTVTDVDGNYKIDVPSEGAVLVFSSIGFVSEEANVGSQSVINISLSPDVTSLEEIVVVGYGVQRKSDLTGAVASVKAEELAKIGGSNAAEALQGKAPGIEILNQGGPGAAPRIRVRGLGTNGNPDPLYVVDGMIVGDIGFLASADIESIEILKDASATAIYGARGANGVVLVTTKKGKSGKPVVNVSGSEGYQFLTRKYDAANGSEYARLVNLFKSNMGQPEVYSQSEIDSFGEGTDWTKESTQKGRVRDYQVSVAGGSDNVNYNVSASYFSQEGVVKFTNYDRFTLRVNNEYKLGKRISVGHNISFINSNTSGDAFWNGGRGLNSMSRISPLLSVSQADGSFTPAQDADIVNPYAAFYYNKDNNSDKLQLVGNAWTNIEIIKGLTFRSSFGVDYGFTKGNRFTPKYEVQAPHQVNGNASVFESRITDYAWLWENTLTYDKQIGVDHHINLLAGITAQERNYDNVNMTGTGLPSESPSFWHIQSFPSASISFGGSLASSSIQSYLFRANYSFKDRYLLTGSMRADGSSKFPKDQKWGYFPSVALGWRISEEAFLKNSSLISNLKLRGSWGQIGSDKIDDYLNYSFLDSWSEYDAVFNGTFYRNATINRYSSGDLTWEFSEQMDLGLELGLLNGRLSVELDYYTRDTEDLLLTLPIPGGSVGFAPSVSNAGSVRNRGFEFMTSWNANAGELEYGIRLNGSINRNTVLDFKDQEVISNEWMTNAEHITKEGSAIGNFYGYKVAGIFQSQEQIDEYNANAEDVSGIAGKQYWTNAKPGDFIYEDIDGNGFIDNDDKTDIGSPHAKFVGGITLTAAYKGFDLALDFVGSFGGEVWNVARNQILTSGTSNLHTEWLDSWTTENTDTDMPRLASDANYMGRGSSFNVMDATYIKARNIELGYTFNESLLSKARISNLRLYVNLTNPFYITKYPGFSPEVSNYWGVMDQGNDFRTYPVAGTARVGLNLSF